MEYIDTIQDKEYGKINLWEIKAESVEEWNCILDDYDIDKDGKKDFVGSSVGVIAGTVQI